MNTNAAILASIRLSNPKTVRTLSTTPSAIARRFQRATETQDEKSARLAKRYAGLARFNNMRIGYAK